MGVSVVEDVAFVDAVGNFGDDGIAERYDREMLAIVQSLVSNRGDSWDGSALRSPTASADVFFSQLMEDADEDKDDDDALSFNEIALRGLFQKFA